MKDIILLVCLIAMGVYGYFLMGRLDKFLDENHKAIQKQETNEVGKFRDEHPCVCVVVCDSEELEYLDYTELYDA